jgi:lipopolysaccharide transport system permease protein
MIPERFRFLAVLNPIAGIIEAFRSSVVPTRAVDWKALGVSVAVTLLVFVLGFIYFRKTEREFADVI